MGLKSHTCTILAQVWPSSICFGAELLEQDVVAWDSGEVILFGVFCLGILTAACLDFSCWCCCCGPSPKNKRVPRAVALRWASAVTRALRFIRRRRRISLAFANYKNKPLRQLPSTPPDRRRSARRPSPELTTPLREGPAIRRHGSYGDGA